MDKLFNGLPFLGAYSRFHGLTDRRHPETNAIELDLGDIKYDIDIGMWAFFLDYVDNGRISEHRLSVIDDRGTEHFFILNDANVLEVTRYADLMNMSHFLDELHTIILQAAYHSPFDDFFECNYN